MPRRTTKTSTPRRKSDATRAAILEAARARFAADGYERTTIRAIAADARIDPALVMRYYGNKEKLFAMAAEFDLRLPDLAAMPRRQVGARLVAHFLNRWEDDEGLKILLRAAATNDVAASRLRAIFRTQIASAIEALNDDGTAAARAGLVFSQAAGLALARYLLRIPPIAAMSREELIEWLGPTFQRYLTGKP
jgi:AcrR family transcriptional regulator